MIMIFFLFVITLELLVFGYLPFGFLSLSVPRRFFTCFYRRCYFWCLIAILRRRYSGSVCGGGRFFSFSFFIGVVVGLLYNIVHTPKYYRGLVCVCICRTRADSLCCVRDDDQGRCSDTDRYVSPHSTFLFLFATSFSISYSFLFFLSFLSLDICRRNLGAVDPRINFYLLFPTSFVHRKRETLFAALVRLTYLLLFFFPPFCVCLFAFSNRSDDIKKKGTEETGLYLHSSLGTNAPNVNIEDRQRVFFFFK